MEIVPPKAHMRVALDARPGEPPTIGVLAHIQRPAGEGIQGIGVRTPRAAAVAEATWGFAIDLHIPQGVTLLMGATSLMVSAGLPPKHTVEIPIS